MARRAARTTRRPAATTIAAHRRRTATDRHEGDSVRYAGIAARSTSAPPRPRATSRSPEASADDIGASLLNRHRDLVQRAEGAIVVRTAELAMAEPRQLEQPRQRRHRSAGQGQSRQRLAHELRRGVPGFALDTRRRRDALESPVAPDDGAARVALGAQGFEALLRRLGGFGRLRSALGSLLPPLRQAL